MTAIARLVAGDLSPRDAFWNWLVFRGLVLNLACTFAALVLVEMTGRLWIDPLVACLIAMGLVPIDTVEPPEPVEEDAPADPRNVYAATKLHQELAGGVFVDVIVDEAKNPESEHPWKGDIDLGKLEALSGVRQIPIRVKCATLAWHTLVAAIDNRFGIMDIGNQPFLGNLRSHPAEVRPDLVGRKVVATGTM